MARKPRKQSGKKKPNASRSKKSNARRSSVRKRNQHAGGRVSTAPKPKRKGFGRAPERLPGIVNTLLYDFRGLNKAEVMAQLGRVRATLACWLRQYKLVTVAIEWRGIKYETDEGEEGPRANWWEPFVPARTVDDPLFTGQPGWSGVREILSGYGGKLRKIYLGVFIK